MSRRWGIDDYQSTDYKYHVVEASNPYGLPEDVFEQIQEEARRAVARTPPMPDSVFLDVMRFMGLTPEGRRPEVDQSAPEGETELDPPVMRDERGVRVVDDQPPYDDGPTRWLLVGGLEHVGVIMIVCLTGQAHTQGTEAVVSEDERLSVQEAEARLGEVVASVTSDDHRVILSVSDEPVAALVSLRYLEGLEETLEIMSDPELMREIKAAEAEIASGQTVDLQQVLAEFRIAHPAAATRFGSDKLREGPS
jgi:antitoxin YefM